MPIDQSGLERKTKQAIRDKVLYAWKQVLPESAGNLGNKALEVEQWQRLTRAFPPPVIEIFIEIHEDFKERWRDYINALPNTYADPRPLLSKTVSAEAWVFGPDHAGLPKLKPRWDVHLSGDDDQLDCAGESLSSVLGERPGSVVCPPPSAHFTLALV